MATPLRVGTGAPSFVQQVTLTPSSVPNNNISTETYTVNGLLPEMYVSATGPSLPAGVFLLSAFCTAINVLQLSFQNVSGSTWTPAAMAFNVYAD